MPKNLSPAEVDAFRTRLCKVAQHRFATQGRDGVSSFAGSSARYPLRARILTPGRATFTSIARYLPSNVVFDAAYATT